MYMCDRPFLRSDSKRGRSIFILDIWSIGQDNNTAGLRRTVILLKWLRIYRISIYLLWRILWNAGETIVQCKN